VAVSTLIAGEKTPAIARIIRRAITEAKVIM
jgi:hypothetical protein